MRGAGRDRGVGGWRCRCRVCAQGGCSACCGRRPKADILIRGLQCSYGKRWLGWCVRWVSVAPPTDATRCNRRFYWLAWAASCVIQKCLCKQRLALVGGASLTHPTIAATPLSSAPNEAWDKDDRMNIHMLPEEKALFLAVLGETETFLEFGAGGSTFHAAKTVRRRIISVNSDVCWLEKVRNATAADPATHLQPELVHVDIGPTGDWGYPLDSSTSERWPAYSQQVWNVAGADRSDTFFIDGRFRVACFTQVALRCRPDATIIFHDFRSRSHYHVVLELGRAIATVVDLTVFVRRSDFDADRAARLLETYCTNPS